RGLAGMFVVEATMSKTAGQKTLEAMLVPERFNSHADLTEAQLSKVVMSRFVRRLDFKRAVYKPTDVPSAAIQFCCTDLVVIADEQLGRLRDKQLTAIDQWVQAGGAACIVPSGSLEPTHMAFLNALADKQSDSASPFLTNAEGVLADRDYDDDGISLYRRGLGRVAIVSPEIEIAQLSPSAVGRMGAFLWRIRAEHESVREGGKWPLPVKRLDPSDLAGKGNYGYYHQFSAEELAASPDQDGEMAGYGYTPIPAINGLLTRTMPENVQLIPFGVVGSLLVLYILAIGPGDYFLLGLLKVRKYTWVLFPLVTLAFTLFTVWLSHSYMGSTEPGKPVVFIDVIEGNAAARSNELSLIFSGTQRTVVDKVSGGIATGIDHHKFFGHSAVFSGRSYQSSTGMFSMPAYTGRFPSNYQMVQNVGQWAPHLTRTLRIAPKVNMPRFDFDDSQVTAFLPWQDQAGLNKAIRAGFDSPVSAYVYYRNDVTRLMADAGDLFKTEDVGTAYAGNQLAIEQRQPVHVLHELCARSPIELFRVMYQISPNGGATFEDMTLLDTSDPSQWLLVIVVQEKEGHKVYRRLYQIDDSITPPDEQIFDDGLDGTDGGMDMGGGMGVEIEVSIDPAVPE
ncbi:hypothetical protein OAH18_02605, partial [bacterium]|nr:hypothetical protein [bacterium]